MEMGSAARELVESFPPSGKNYEKVISQLKTRFAMDEFLIEVYVRELLNLVLNQAMKNKSGMTLSTLFDKLETQLRALESLGVTSDKYAAMLYPLAESALPEDLLKVWERHRSTNKNLDSKVDSSNHLQMLLDFLRAEVESEERIKLARTSFVPAKEKGWNTRIKQQQNEPELHTAATIFSARVKDGKKTNFDSCLFCENKSHSSQDCIKAQKLTYDEKKGLIMKKRCCFACLRPNHNVRMCKAYIKCLICGKKHFAIMCPDLNVKNKETEREREDLENKRVESTLTNNNHTETLLQTIIVRLVSDKKRKVVRALLDSGSQRSYILSGCAVEMKFRKIGEESIIQGVFGGLESAAYIHNLYDVSIENLNKSFKFNWALLDQQNICNFVPRLNNSACITKLKTKNIDITDVGSNVTEISLLLGADIIGQLFTGCIEKIDDSLVAMETRLGWTVMGQYNGSSNLVHITCFNNISLTDLWELDVLGIKDPTDIKTKDDLEADALRHFKETVKINGESRYEVCLPWIEGYPKILSNIEVSESRLHNTTKKLLSMNKFSDYDEALGEWQKLGIIEEVPEAEKKNIAHYLPHHAVIKESSATTKIRPVFDASAKDKRGNSLNDGLEKGPNLIELIPSLLLKFRLRSIGVTADIKKAFLQISITPQDRDFLRFLWWEDYQSKKMKIYRHCRVVFGVSPSPFLLAATIDHHLEKAPQYLKETAEKLRKSFYVDNCITSVDNKKELNKFINESKYLMEKAQFDLRGWEYNEPKEESEDFKILSNPSEDVVSVLGLQWNFKHDTLFCDIQALIQIDTTKVTKRGLLSAAQRIFDPIGFTTPVTLLPKLLLQETWKLKCGWDKPLPEDIVKRFLTWLKYISFVKFCMLPRTVNKFSWTNCEDFTIHVFCDASKLAYATCIFLRAEVAGIVSVQLIQSKSRITPMKPTTLPRLELLAAVIGCRLCKNIKEVKELSCLKTYYWSDSMVVLTWIKTKADWNTFVGNRVKEIRLYSKTTDWHHVPGKLNAADLPSRGCNGKTLLESKWWEGPEWLREKLEVWPHSEIICSEEEVNAEKRKHIISTLINQEKDKTSDGLNYFSQYFKIKRLVAWMLRFIYNSRNRDKIVDELSYNELEKAEVYLLKLIQFESFGKNNETIQNLHFYKDNKGLMRIKTKLILGEDADDFKCPILLPSNHEIVHKLINEQHRISSHAGVQTLLCILREKFWILKGRKTVSQVVSKCVTCKRYTTKPAETPFAPLPTNRIKNAAAFEVTGIDLAGPLYLKGKEKAWIVLFTCAVYRAVHFELITSLSTDAVILALRRFVARRGRISVIYTDNGTNFVGANNNLKKLDWNEILTYSSVRRIKWNFNPPTAAWWGGWWERIVRMIKELLRRNLGKASIYYEELMTVLCDCEAIINSRPLTYVSNEANDLIPLTPSIFLQSITCCELPDFDAIDRTHLIKRHKYLQKLRDNLRERFRKEYLADLVHCGKRRVTKIQVGDVVLVESDHSKRINWPLAKVIEIYPGRDNVPRVARVKLAGGELVRPFQRLYPLEVSGGDCKVFERESKSKTDLRSSQENGEICLEKKIFEDSVDTKCKTTTRSGRVVKTPNRLGI